MLKILAIIPARGGSKSIPRKNIRLLNGKPLITYCIATALSAKLIDRVIVSTDDPEIAKVAKKAGAEAPFLRPKRFAQDNSLDLPVFTHTLNWLAANQNYIPDIVVHLRPTSPMRDATKVDAAITMLLNNPKADSVRAVIPSSQNPFKMWRIVPSGFMKPLITTKFKEAYNMPRQLLPKTYWQTGYIDVIRPSIILKKHSMTGDSILPFIMDSTDFVDIDTQQDWKKAEKLFSNTNKH